LAPRMAARLMAGALLDILPAAILPARDRIPGDRALRSDLPKPAPARLPSDEPAPQRALRMVARVFLCLSDDDDRCAGAQICRGSWKQDLRASTFGRAPLHHRTRRAA